MGVAIFFTLIRTTIRLYLFRRLYADDICVYIALVSLLSTGVLITLIVPILFEFEYILHGQKGITTGFVQRVNYFLRMQFAIIVLFWTSIWGVKFSFLVWYRTLLAAPADRVALWWGVFSFTILAYIGCWITQLQSCRPMSKYFSLGVYICGRYANFDSLKTSGGCQSHRDIWVSNLSLYFSTAADIACDLLSKKPIPTTLANWASHQFWLFHSTSCGAYGSTEDRSLLSLWYFRWCSSSLSLRLSELLGSARHQNTWIQYGWLCGLWPKQA